MVPTRPVDGAEAQLRKLLAAGIGQQAFNLVASLDGTDAGGRASQNQVSFLQDASDWSGNLRYGGTHLEGHDRRDVLDEPGEGEDHVLRVAILLDRAVNLLRQTRHITSATRYAYTCADLPSTRG